MGRRTVATVLVLLLIALLCCPIPVSADDKTPAPVATASPSPAASNGAKPVLLRVDVGGGGYTDPVTGLAWDADHPYAPAGGGSTIGWGYLGPRWMQVIGTSRPVAGTSASKVYQTQRQDATGYRFDLPNGQYRVTLRLAELYVNAGPGTNVFDVFCQGQRALGAVDVARNVGIYKAYDLMFTAKVTAGVLNIAFVPKSGAIAIAGLDVESAAAIAAAQTPAPAKTGVASPVVVVTSTVPLTVTTVTTTLPVTVTAVTTSSLVPTATKLPSPPPTILPTATPTVPPTATPLPTSTPTSTSTPSFTATVAPSQTSTETVARADERSG